ncbi:Holliday junction branch migration protein RuvA [Candidatus Phytoplasma oryzae]|nr:Holliday junction branch migration protein RuvA [Candidatus Phytoplasma oryzae]
MFYYFKGTILEIKKNSVILENFNIGYVIYFYKPENFFVLNQEVKIFTHFYVRENINCLYGFLNKEMLFFFQKLINIPGIGPKSALSMSNSDFLQQIKESLKNNNLSKLLEFPGIGQKTAKQIIFHFKDDLLFFDNENLFLNKKKNVLEALMSLGFNKKEIEIIFPKLNFEENLEVIIKKALFYLNRN